MCRGVVRMGRAYNAMIQQRRKADAELYLTLRKALQAELAEMIANDSLRPKYVLNILLGFLIIPCDLFLFTVYFICFYLFHDSFVFSLSPYLSIYLSLSVCVFRVNLPAKLAAKGASAPAAEHVTKVFRRLDVDGDGKLTILEFKSGLKRLKVNNLKKWNNRQIRKLFDECDRNKDGRLDITEFFNFIRAGLAPGTKLDLSEGAAPNQGKRGSASALLLDGDEDEDRLFNAQRKVTDSELFRKVN